MRPSGLKPEYLRECVDVLSDDPPVLRWRTRPRSHFETESACRIWNKANASRTIRPRALDGRLRLHLSGEAIDAKMVIAEIGVTPIGDQQSVPDDAPNDRLAATRQIAGTGPLAQIMQRAMAKTGLRMGDLTVMSDDADPYRLDTPANRFTAQWFAKQVRRFVPPGRRIHPRGVFYACVSAGDVLKPDGELFENTAENADFLNKAARYARWLGYVPFERIADHKNDAPVVREAPSSAQPIAHVWADDLEIDELDADSLGVSARLVGFTPRQPYRLALFGEKTSLEDVLAPLAEEFSADLYLTGGQISDTLLHGMACDAVADGRPLVVVTFSDFDPAGYWDMPTAIGRKLEALRDLLFSTLRFTVRARPRTGARSRPAGFAAEGGRKARRKMAGALRLGANRDRRARHPATR
jgi:hypothetical protein